MKRIQTTVEEFDPARVLPFPGQPRKRFAGLQELAQSIKAVGQIIPGKVTLLSPQSSSLSTKYDARLIDGERRLRACQLAGVDFRAEVLTDAGSDDRQFETSLAANFGKQDHDCIEIAEALGRLQKNGRTIAQMSDICGGKSSTWILQHLSLLKLHPKVQAMFLPAEKGEDREPRLSLGIGTLLANHPHEFQFYLAGRITGKSTLEARRIILRLCQRRGVRATINTTSPAKHFSKLETCIQHIKHRLGVFVDMPGKDFTSVLNASTATERRQLVNTVNVLNDQLSDIADQLENSLKSSSGPKPFVKDYGR